MSIRGVKLTIDGVLINLNDQRIRLDSLIPWKKDDLPVLKFTQESIFPVDVDPWVNKLVELSIDDGTSQTPQYELVFVGVVTRRVVGFTRTGWAYGYESLGIESLANDWPIVSPFDGTGSVTFNLQPTDVNYDVTYSGLTLAGMIRKVLEEVTTAKHFAGTRLGRYYQDTVDPFAWHIDQRTIDDLNGDPYLSAMMPPRTITFSGDSLLQGIRNVLQASAPNHCVWVQPVTEPPPGKPSDPAQSWGVIRFTNVINRPAVGTVPGRPKTGGIALDLSKDPAPDVQRNYSTSFPRVVVRGGPTVKPCILSLNANDISPDFRSPWYANNTLAIADWKLSTWLDRTQQIISGRCWTVRPRSTSNPDEVTEFFPNTTDPSKPIPNPDYIASIYDKKLTSPSWLLIDPDKPLANVPDYSWNANVWGQTSAQYGGSVLVTRVDPVNPYWKQSDVRNVANNTNLTAGGQCYLALEKALPLTGYSNFTLTASQFKGSMTWRRYHVNAKLIDGTPVVNRVQAAFPSPFPWVQSDGSVVSCTTTGTAQIFYRANATANTTSSQFVGFQTDRATGSIIFDRPLVMCFGDYNSLVTGGANVSGQPTEIKVLLPVSYGALETQCPHDTANTVNANLPILNYRGTSNTVDGLTRTRYINVPEWVSEADAEMMWQWGNSQLDTMCDTVVEGRTQVYRCQPVIGPGTWVKWIDPCWMTGKYDFLTTDVRGCEIQWHHGQAAVPVTTTFILSNRRDPYATQTASVFHPVVYPQPGPGQYSITGESSPYSTNYSMLSDSGKAFTDAFGPNGSTVDTPGLAAEDARKQAAGIGFTSTFEERAATMDQAGAESARRAEEAGIRAAIAGTLGRNGE